MKNEKEITEEMQLVTAQMIKDDIEENPDIVNEFFECDCCGADKCLAGSVEYNGYRLCNDCVLIAEISFALKKITDIQELIDLYEDKNLAGLCQYIKQEESRENN
ncbi:MAG: hypothetical protein LBK53_03110 [Heliobacteriaceae bacterium]|jgi:hypothetical protein|nr:hypothetical protein [Heliobacteriaceae bacterium]